MARATVPTRRAAGDRLDRRALNRALLARQHLLERARMPALDMVEHLVGLQAQDPKPPYLGLWSRLANFDPLELSRHLERREAVRVALMRSTIHLVSVRDARWLRPLHQPMLERIVLGSYRRALDGLDPHEVAAAGRALLEREPMTHAAVGAALLERYPERDPRALAAVVRAFVPLVQVTPRGLWGASGPAAHAPLERWLGRPLDDDDGGISDASDLERLVLRYLAAFGPASVMDVQAWSGLTRLGAVLVRLRPQLVTFTDDRGRELFDLPDAPRPERDVPAPIRFLPPFDNLLLAHADRRRVIDDQARRAIATLNGMVPGALLVDGFFAARWHTEKARDTCTLVILQHRQLARRRRAIEAEAHGLLRLLAPDLEHAIRYEDAR